MAFGESGGLAARAPQAMPIHRTQMDVSSAVEGTLRTIFRRCVQCPDETPTCPSCSNGEICSLVPTSCTACAVATCVRNPTTIAAPGSGPNVGAIAGGVVGGVAAVAVAVFLIWTFYIKKRRAEQEAQAEEWEEDDIARQKSTYDFHAMQHDATSTRTRGSFANSILSRASNFIQIAYIPGVTNRNGDTPPVPPIPAARRDNNTNMRSPLANDDGALFFMPGDLRGSTYSDTSSISNNRDTQYTKRDTQYSITPSLARSSYQSGIYQDDTPMPPMPMPAQQVVRAAPRMVSVKSNSSLGSPGVISPGAESPMLTSEHGDFAAAANTPKPIQIMMPGSDNSSIKSGKAQQITLGGKGKSGRFPVRQASDASTLTAGKFAPMQSSPLAGGDADMDALSTPPTSQPTESPFFDPSEVSGSASNPYASMGKSIGSPDRPKRTGKGMGALSDIIEEATKRASMVMPGQLGDGKRDASPFSDVHELDEK